MLDPIRDSWEARISSMRMSSKNLFGENAEKCKKYRKINIQRLSNFVSKTIKILFVEKQKRENLRKSFAFASAKYGGVGKSEQE